MDIWLKNRSNNASEEPEQPAENGGVINYDQNDNGDL